MEAIAKGVLSGLGYGLLLGPLFFLNIRITLSQGLRQGIALVAGAFTSDLCLVMASWWSAGRLSNISKSNVFQGWFGLIFGLMLLGFGLAAAWPRRAKTVDPMQIATPSSKRRFAYFQGLLINFANPSNWLFWLSVAAVAKSESPAGANLYMRSFMGAALLTLFATDLSKVLLANQLSRWMKPGVPEKIVRVAGIILTGLSIWVLSTVIKNWV